MSWQAVTMMAVMIGVYFGGLIYFALKGERKDQAMPLSPPTSEVDRKDQLGES